MVELARCRLRSLGDGHSRTGLGCRHVQPRRPVSVLSPAHTLAFAGVPLCERRYLEQLGGALACGRECGRALPGTATRPRVLGRRHVCATSCPRNPRMLHLQAFLASFKSITPQKIPKKKWRIALYVGIRRVGQEQNPTEQPFPRTQRDAVMSSLPLSSPVPPSPRHRYSRPRQPNTHSADLLRNTTPAKISPEAPPF